MDCSDRAASVSVTVVLLTRVQEEMTTRGGEDGGIFTRLASRQVRCPARQEPRAWVVGMRRSAKRTA